MKNFQELVDELLEFMWRSSPFKATLAGIHKYDQEMDQVDRTFLEDCNNKRKEYLHRIERLDKNGLTGEERIDWLLLRNLLESNIRSFEEIRHWEKHGAFYANICVDSLFILLIREFAPIEDRAIAILSRMNQIPRVLEAGKNNLKDSPGIFTRLAIEVTEAGKGFLHTLVPQLSTMVPKIRRDLEKANRKALLALDDYCTFLKDEYLPRSRGDFAIGSDLFNFKLKNDHMLPFDADEILEIGRESKRSTEDAIKRVARKIDGNKSWLELVEAIKKEHPQASELLAAYKRGMDAAKRFVYEKDLVTIRPGELEIIPTPPFNRPIIPYAAYMSPAPFEKQQKGYFFVTPVEDILPREKQEEILRGHPTYGIPVTALHEGYPGHHLQLVHANGLRNRLHRLFVTTVFVEGWALYCEEMMYEAGFYTDLRSRLLQLKDQLWRSCRVIVDVGLHTKKMDYAQAVDLLVNDAGLQRVHAEKEVTRYTFTPTQPLSYMIGKKQILEMKRDYEKKSQGKFNLKEFHDRLLSFGSIPICLIREALGI